MSSWGLPLVKTIKMEPSRSPSAGRSIVAYGSPRRKSEARCSDTDCRWLVFVTMTCPRMDAAKTSRGLIERSAAIRRIPFMLGPLDDQHRSRGFMHPD